MYLILSIMYAWRELADIDFIDNQSLTRVYERELVLSENLTGCRRNYRISDETITLLKDI